MHKIYLTSHPYEWRGTGPVYAIVAPGYPAPPGMDVASVDRVLAEPGQWLERQGTQIVVGMSRLLTPSNRVRLGQAVLRPRQGLTRISVDELLFVSDPWRAFWHFYAVGAHEGGGLTDSYLAETRWKAAHEMRTPDPFNRERIVSAMDGIVEGHDPFRFGPVEIETRLSPEDAHLRYVLEKERAFTDEATFPAIVRRLAGIAQDAVPERSIPGISSIFRHRDRRPIRIVRTDLKIDEYLVGELLHRIEITNAIAGAAGGIVR
jgi:hypothetical protein